MDDSSPDLSLKLRRRSSDSRDSFYMDFAQGIDSDIEEVACVTNVILEEDNGLSDVDVAEQSAKENDELPPPPPIPPVRDETSEILLEDQQQIKTISPPPEITSTSPIWRLDIDETIIEETDPEIGLDVEVEIQQSLEEIHPDVEADISVHLPSPATTKPILVSPEKSSPLHDDTDEEHPLSEDHPPSKTKSTPVIMSRPASSVATSHHMESPLRSISHSPAPPSTSFGPPIGYSAPTPTPSAATSIPIHHSAPLGPIHSFPQAPQHLSSVNISKRPSRIDQLESEWRKLGTDALTTTLSALYGKLLVVMGIAFPIAEVISTQIPPSFYEAFYLYLYFGSMFFLIYMYALLCHEKADISKTKFNRSDSSLSMNDHEVCEGPIDVESAPGTEGVFRHGTTTIPVKSSSAHHLHLHHHQHHYIHSYYGSFYLRMGAVAFGIGSMIYSGLEFGQYFELEADTNCHNIIVSITPAARMTFIFVQMYFIFLNNEQLGVTRQRAMARFGLMHMIGTNISVWLNVLIQETKHEILNFYDSENDALQFGHRNGAEIIGIVADQGNGFSSFLGFNQGQVLRRPPRGLKGPQYLYECRRTNIMGSLVQDVSPFLFPCIIEYSLICSAILYVMWKNISKPQIPYFTPGGLSSNLMPHSPRIIPPAFKQRSTNQYTVDCARAHKGLFLGILILVLTIISIILFFVLISRRDLIVLAVMEVNLCELTLYAASTVATLFGMIQVRQLKYDGCRNLELDNILLIGAQTGLFIYSTFTIIGGQFTLETNTILILITAFASLVETTCQTMFILDASRRTCATADQIRRKPGRQLVTFLLVTNLAMCAINTLEKSRAESNPIQMHFYGLWAWTIINHISMPLAIFYRFHSTVCLCEIWKRAYKMKPAFM